MYKCCILATVYMDHHISSYKKYSKTSHETSFSSKDSDDALEFCMSQMKNTSCFWIPGWSLTSESPQYYRTAAMGVRLGNDQRFHGSQDLEYSIIRALRSISAEGKEFTDVCFPNSKYLNPLIGSRLFVVSVYYSA